MVSEPKKKDPRTEVTVETALVRNLVSTVSATGTIEPVNQVKVSAEIPGRIVNLTVKEGDHVEQGQFLVELDRETYLAALESATSGLRAARGQKEKAEADLNRVRELVSRGMASQADLDAAKAAPNSTPDNSTRPWPRKSAPARISAKRGSPRP